MKTKTYTLNQIRVLAQGWENDLIKAINNDAPTEQIRLCSAQADLWRVRLIVAQEEHEQSGKTAWIYEVGDDRPTALHYAWVALGVVFCISMVPFIVEAIVWVASVWGL